MNKPVIIMVFLYLFFFFPCCKSPAGSENTTVLMKTTLGDIKLKLYDGTPLHRDNFIKLVNTGFYDGISFHRVINSFMIQAGDPSTSTVSLPDGSDSLNTHTIPAEFNPLYFHKKGALAAAREGNEVNPDMRSSGTQFYIVQGSQITDQDILLAEQSINNNLRQAMFYKSLKQVSDSANKSGLTLSAGEIQERASSGMFEFLSATESFEISDEQRMVYKTAGGVPRLDGTYTVFGEVIEGIDVVDRIAAVPTDNSDKPLSDVKILKMKITDK